MKQPKLNDLAIDQAGTKNLRAQLNKTKTIRITIHIDAVSLGSKRKSVGQTSLPYQQILAQALNEASNAKAISRLDRIERELKKLKRQIAA